MEAIPKNIEELLLTERWLELHRLLKDEKPGITTPVKGLIFCFASAKVDDKVNSCNYIEMLHKADPPPPREELENSTDPFIEYKYKKTLVKSVKIFEKWCRELIKKHPQNPIPHELLGFILYRSIYGVYGLAIDEYTKAIELSPPKAHLYNERGNLYALIREYEKSISDHTRAIELNPENKMSYECRLLSYRAIKEHDKALIDANTLITKYPEDPEGYYLRAGVYKFADQPEKALEDINRAIAMNPRYVDAYISRANIYIEINEKEKARQDYEKVKELRDPKDYDIGLFIDMSFLEKELEK